MSYHPRFNPRGRNNYRGRDKGKSGRGTYREYRDRSSGSNRDESAPVNQAFTGNYDQVEAGPSLIWRYLVHL